MEDRRPPRQPFLRPALGESLPATAPPVAEELPLLDPPPRQPSLDEVLPGREDPPETAWLESPEDAWAAEEELLAPATPARPVVPPDARFQIQIMSTSDPETAEDMRLQAELVFAGAAVEVVWDPPNYKVRVGGVATMEEAGELKRQALRLGFNNAWVVPRRQP
jgi:cell division protein FtsN